MCGDTPGSGAQYGSRLAQRQHDQKIRDARSRRQPVQLGSEYGGDLVRTNAQFVGKRRDRLRVFLVRRQCGFGQADPMPLADRRF
jgi:hypothetical protein